MHLKVTYGYMSFSRIINILIVRKLDCSGNFLLKYMLQYDKTYAQLVQLATDFLLSP